ncbi:MAG: hypothetical protein ACREDU_08255, partial [Methylocella sp.]
MALFSIIQSGLLAISAYLGSPEGLPLNRYCVIRTSTEITKVYDHNKKESLKFREKILLMKDESASDSVILHVENLDEREGIRWTRLYYSSKDFATFLQEGTPARASRALVKKGGVVSEVPPDRVQKGANFLEEVFP